MNSPSQSRPWYHRVGPGLITACVVIGPGSILTSSNVGATAGYGRSWVVVASVFFMLIFMSMGARLGVSAKESAGTILARDCGRWFAILIGASVFFISAAFQFGNNLGVHYALNSYIQFDYLVVIFNALAIGFLLIFRDMYRALEKLMMFFVGMMLIAFATNLMVAGPRWGEWATGFIPQAGTINLSVLGLIGTTFVTTAAFYQSYLVRQKGWTEGELRDGLIDVRVGAIIMALITLMLMATPATVFHPDFQHQRVFAVPGSDPGSDAMGVVVTAEDAETQDRLVQALRDEKSGDEPRWAEVWTASQFAEKHASLGDEDLKPRNFGGLPEVGQSLQPLFQGVGPHLFFLGVFAAAYSSFLVNSMIGGFILADGLGIGDKPDDKWPKIFTICVLLTGMCVGLYCVIGLQGARPVALIVAAQAVTVIASPLVAGSLLWVTSRRDVMGENANSPLQMILGGCGFALLLVMSGYLATSQVWPRITAALGFV